MNWLTLVTFAFLSASVAKEVEKPVAKFTVFSVTKVDTLGYSITGTRTPSSKENQKPGVQRIFLSKEDSRAKACLIEALKIRGKAGLVITGDIVSLVSIPELPVYKAYKIVDCARLGRTDRY